MNFIAMDFETANHLPYSACSLALVMVQESKIVGEYYSLIQPETEFFWRNIQVHGIHPEDVRQAPKFPDVWKNIQNYFHQNSLIVAHNAAFDTKVLAGCLDYYQLEQPNYLSLCTVKTSRKLFPEMQNHRLNTVCANLDITLQNHHDALEDSRACAEILLYQESHFGVEPLKKLVTVK
ncbi:exonuclease, DNA polymerase III, epsilon subunit [Enterococcus phoeniculicola]|jgi:DNA polymerase-3 subunit epsilon|uniref:DNA polymerase III polC-type n=1 Tax=Enterococcus phoeniculicola ATCC BAA-412 TaxID=1158610 RepID=R3TMN9_9ENTE|nr:3'-5' exonuclease [Enterococcus phoeniculicola]EOL42318.1 exonuclease, DNA polymerase III, epsilon subunit [Enterococcus phoeniculicola ATCC BAA-412]EOT79403.1 exonuclease, DNA polymerase III, epsilon subunit protein [Enterococcus phoeniculicola ATCC BAA-412]OJG73058.1 exonuclease, DNA polymerase III, epsilon subunit [Enterococcus phoeniculicola]